MTRTHASMIGLVFSALFAGHAMAADAGTSLTRAQVKAELAEAVRTGDVVVVEHGAKMNEIFPQLYPVQDATPGMTRAQVQTELAEAVRTGNMAPGEGAVALNEAFPQLYPAQHEMAGKTRDEVKAELAEAVRMGHLERHIAA